MLDRRAMRIVWAFLLGVILSEGWVLWLSFPNAAGLLHYLTAAPGTPLAWLSAAAIAFAYVFYAATGSPIIRANMLSPSRWRPYAAMRLVAIPMALVSGFFEEAFFRKLLMDAAMHHGAPVAAQIALSALAFGAAHAIWGVLGGSLRGAVGAMLATGMLGTVLGLIYVLGGRSIGPCIAAHVAINLLIEPWLIITAATDAWRARSIRGPAPA